MAHRCRGHGHTRSVFHALWGIALFHSWPSHRSDWNQPAWSPPSTSRVGTLTDRSECYPFWGAFDLYGSDRRGVRDEPGALHLHHREQHPVLIHLFAGDVHVAAVLVDEQQHLHPGRRRLGHTRHRDPGADDRLLLLDRRLDAGGRLGVLGAELAGHEVTAVGDALVERAVVVREDRLRRGGGGGRGVPARGVDLVAVVLGVPGRAGEERGHHGPDREVEGDPLQPADRRLLRPGAPVGARPRCRDDLAARLAAAVLASRAGPGLALRTGSARAFVAGAARPGLGRGTGLRTAVGLVGGGGLRRRIVRGVRNVVRSVLRRRRTRVRGRRYVLGRLLGLHAAPVGGG